MKKLLAALLAMMMIIACAIPAMADEGSEPDWTAYDALIKEIKSTTDFVNREALMHQAEDILMETGCLVPLYFYTDIYMIDENVEGFFCNPLGYKYFMYTTVNEAA